MNSTLTQIQILKWKKFIQLARELLSIHSKIIRKQGFEDVSISTAPFKVHPEDFKSYLESNQNQREYHKISDLKAYSWEKKPIGKDFVAIVKEFEEYCNIGCFDDSIPLQNDYDIGGNILQPHQEERRWELIQICMEGREIIQQKIDQLIADSEEERIIDLVQKLALHPVDAHMSFLIMNPEFIKEQLDKPFIKRRRFILSRGFGEYFHGSTAWDREIFQCLWKIERYSI